MPNEKEKKTNILVVDDEESVAKFVAELLKSEGYHPEIHLCPQQALDAFNKNPAHYSMLITDQTMPKMLGTELAEKVMMQRPELPVVLCTGYSSSVDEARAKQKGIKAFFNKPIELMLFLSTIGALLAELISAE